MVLAKKHISYPMHKTNSLAGLTFIFSTTTKKTQHVLVTLNTVLCLYLSKKGWQAEAKKKNQSLNSSNLFSTQVCFKELQQF